MAGATGIPLVEKIVSEKRQRLGNEKLSKKVLLTSGCIRISRDGLGETRVQLAATGGEG